MEVGELYSGQKWDVAYSCHYKSCCVIVINLAGMTLSALAREAADSKSVVFGILLLYNMIHLSVPEEGRMFAAEAQDPSALSVS